MEHGALQLTALSPCFLWNQQATGDVKGLEVGAGVGDLLERGVLGGQAHVEIVFTCRDSSNISERRFTDEEEIRLW